MKILLGLVLVIISGIVAFFVNSILVMLIAMIYSCAMKIITGRPYEMTDKEQIFWNMMVLFLMIIEPILILLVFLFKMKNSGGVF